MAGGIESIFERPVPGAADSDRAVLLAHGAGADMHAAPLVAVAEGLAAAGVASLRFNYPYRTAGRRAPDRAPVLLEATRDAVTLLAERSDLPPERLVLGGRSMGGRYCSLVAAAEDDPVPCLGLLLLGYPLRPAGKADAPPRSGHFGRIHLPVLFVSGTRDALAARDALDVEARAVRGPVSFHWIEGGDHGFKVPARMGRSPGEVLTDVAGAAAAWVAAL